MTQTIELGAMRKAVTLRQMATEAITPVSNLFSLVLGERVTNKQTIAVFMLVVGLCLTAFVASSTWYIGVMGISLMAYASNVLRKSDKS